MYPANQHRWQADYAAYHEALANFVAARVAPWEVEDVLQDLWAAYATALERRPPILQPRAWLYRVARNRIADLYRAGEHNPEPLPEEPDYFDDPDWFEEDAMPMDAVRAALAELPRTQREVFERNVLGGETLREIAEELGVSIKTVISRKGYARKRLRQLLAKDFYGPD